MYVKDTNFVLRYTQIPIRNISYSKHVILELQKKYFFNSQSPRHKFTEFSKNEIEDSSINVHRFVVIWGSTMTVIIDDKDKPNKDTADEEYNNPEIGT